VNDELIGEMLTSLGARQNGIHLIIDELIIKIASGPNLLTKDIKFVLVKLGYLRSCLTTERSDPES
jgi:hypothetical protein